MLKYKYMYLNMSSFTQRLWLMADSPLLIRHLLSLLWFLGLCLRIVNIFCDGYDFENHAQHILFYSYNNKDYTFSYKIACKNSLMNMHYEDLGWILDLYTLFALTAIKFSILVELFQCFCWIFSFDAMSKENLRPSLTG